MHSPSRLSVPISPKSHGVDAEHELDQVRFNKALAENVGRFDTTAMWHRNRITCSLAGLCCGTTLVIVLVFVAFEVFFYDDEEITYTTMQRDYDTTVSPNQTSARARNIGDGNDDGTFQHPDRSSDDLEEAAPLCGESCSATVSFVLSQRNFSYDPCQNLYDHVCSRWQLTYRDLAGIQGGRYSTDDIVRDKYADIMGLLITNSEEAPSVPLEARRFFVDCVDGELTNAHGVEDIVGSIGTANLTDGSEEALIETIVRMARVGVSPFFDVYVNAHNESFVVELKKPQFSQNYSFEALKSELSLSFSQSFFDKDKPSVLAGGNDKHPFRAFERLLCREIFEGTRTTANCHLSPNSTIKPAWNYSWYSTEGLKILSQTARSLLQPLIATGTDFEESDYVLPNTQAGGHVRKRSACLYIMDYCNPSWLVNLSLPKRFQVHIQETLKSLKEQIAKELRSVTNVSIVVRSELLTTTPEDFYSSNMQAKSDFGTKDSPLRACLLRSVWNQWLRTPARRASALATSPKFSESSYTLDVPPAALNWSSLDDPLLRYLELARTGTIVARNLFVEGLSAQLRTSRFGRCLTSLADDLSQFHRSRSHDAGRLDTEEVAAFYFSLAAFRAHIKGKFAFGKSSSAIEDALFLFYYALNNCETVCPASTDPPEVPSLRRRRVESVGRVFASTLLEECSGLPNLWSNCETIRDDNK